MVGEGGGEKVGPELDRTVQRSPSDLVLTMLVLSESRSKQGMTSLLSGIDQLLRGGCNVTPPVTQGG